MKTTALIRIRFPFPMVDRLDALAVEIRKLIGGKVARAAVVRALVHLGLDTALAPELATVIAADGVRRGRGKARRA